MDLKKKFRKATIGAVAARALTAFFYWPTGKNLQGKLYEAELTPVAESALRGELAFQEDFDANAYLNEAISYLSVSNNLRQDKNPDRERIGIADWEAFSRLTYVMRFGNSEQSREAEGILYNRGLGALVRAIDVTSRERPAPIFGEHNLVINNYSGRRNPRIDVSLVNNLEAIRATLDLSKRDYTANDLFEGYVENNPGLRDNFYARLPYDPNNNLTLTDSVVDVIQGN